MWLSGVSHCLISYGSEILIKRIVGAPMFKLWEN
jgi:hypothetical protein